MTTNLFLQMEDNSTVQYYSTVLLVLVLLDSSSANSTALLLTQKNLDSDVLKVAYNLLE